VPKLKVDKLKEVLRYSIHCSYMQDKAIASITGKVTSMSLAIGDIARLRTRGLYALLSSRVTWYDHINLSVEAKDELQFWLDSIDIDSYNGRSIWRAPSAFRVVYSDASNTGFGI
jgi:hypothetical protein